MNIEQLNYIHSVFCSGSLKETSDQLFISSQAISKSIKNLETELNGRLVIKDDGLIKPSPLGAAIAPNIARILADVKAIESIARNQSAPSDVPPSVRLSIGCASYRSRSLSKQQIEGIINAFPDTDFEISYMPNGSSAYVALQGASDISIVEFLPQAEEITSFPLKQHNVCIAMSPKNPLASKKRISFVDISKQLIAHPIDVLQFHEHLTKLFKTRSMKPPRFEWAPSDNEGLRDFTDNGGMIFLNKDTNGIKKLIPNIVIKEFAEPDLPCITTYGIFRNDSHASDTCWKPHFLHKVASILEEIE